MFSVLFVEDEPQIRTFIAEYLRNKGFEVQAVESGKAAISMMQAFAFDLVISDQHLRGELSGIDVLAYHNRLSPEKARILFTVTSEDLRDQCQIINALYVQKPIHLDELLAKINKILN